MYVLSYGKQIIKLAMKYSNMRERSKIQIAKSKPS